MTQQFTRMTRTVGASARKAGAYAVTALLAATPLSATAQEDVGTRSAALSNMFTNVGGLMLAAAAIFGAWQVIQGFRQLMMDDAGREDKGAAWKKVGFGALLVGVPGIITIIYISVMGNTDAATAGMNSIGL